MKGGLNVKTLAYVAKNCNISICLRMRSKRMDFRTLSQKGWGGPNFVVCEVGTRERGSSHMLICPILNSDLRSNEDL